mgnify:FL=1
MSIVTFWNDDREQSGKTLTSVAVATRMAIERNYKILLISTSFLDPTIKNCFWGNEVSRNLKLFGGKLNNIAVENGIEGLSKLIAANKLTPDVITDYTKVIFKGRLEVLNGFNGMKDADEMTNIKTYEKIAEGYVDLIRTANQYYDMVLVDLDKTIFAGIREKILEISNVNVMVFSQKKESLDRYIKYKENASSGELNKLVPVIGKYMDQSKYNLKNIMKYIGERKEINVVPFNMLYFEAAEEAMVTDLFLRLKNVKDTSDENYIFMQDVLNLTDKIIKRLQELQMKMRWKDDTN